MLSLLISSFILLIISYHILGFTHSLVQRSTQMCTKTILMAKPLAAPKLSTSDIIQKVFRSNDILQSKSLLPAIQNDAAEKLKTSTLPTSKAEAWRFNNLFQIFRQPYLQILPSDRSNSNDDIADKIKSYVNVNCLQSYYVFVDGYFEADLSQPLANEIECDHLKFYSLRSESELLTAALMKELTVVPDMNEELRNSFNSDLLTLYNLANFQDGAVIQVPSGKILDTPIHLIFVSSGKSASVSHPRTLISLGVGAKAAIKQSHITLTTVDKDDSTENAYLVNSNTRVVLGEGSHLTHTMAQELSGDGRYIEVISTDVSEDSSYDLRLILTGSSASRVNAHINVTGSNANATMQSICLAKEKQSLDLHSSILHIAESSNSLQLHRNIIGDQGESIFKGKIRIPQEAMLSKSEQLCRSILLGERARVVAMPTLEITADNVECSHGAAVSDLDENSVFFFSSRGVDRKTARKLILRSFMVELLSGALMDKQEIRRLTNKLEEIADFEAGKDTQYLSI